MLLIIALLILLLQNSQSTAFQTVSYAYETQISIPQYMSQDLTKIVSQAVTVAGSYSIQIYAVTDKNMTLISQPYLKTCNIIRCSGNVQKLLCIDSTMSILRLFNVTGYDVSFIQQITLASPLVSASSVSFSFDGSYLVVSQNTRTFAIIYQLSGGLYSVISNNPMITVHNVMTASPDGLYLFYGQIASGGSMSLRVFNNSGQVAIYTIATTLPSSYFVQLAISNPQSGVYIVLVVYTQSGLNSMQYHQFDSIAGTLNLMQTFPLIGPAQSLYLTLNGNYYAYASTASGSFYLYKRMVVISAFTLVQQFAMIPAGASTPVFFVSEDGGFIAWKSPVKMVFFFTCNVINCTRCHWKDICQTCTYGLTLANNTCICPLNSTNVSNICITCTLSNCLTCSASNICSVCANGFSLTSAFTCGCVSGYNISSKTGRCVQCNLDGCYRCDYDNNCEVFAVNNASEVKIASLSKQVQNIKSLQIFTTAALACMIIIILIVVIAYLKFKSPQTTSLPIKQKSVHNMRINPKQTLDSNITNITLNNNNNNDISNMQKINANNNQEHDEIEIQWKQKQNNGQIQRKRKKTSRKISMNNTNINLNSSTTPSMNNMIQVKQFNDFDQGNDLE